MKSIFVAIALSALPLLAGTLPNWEFTGGKVGPWKHTFNLTAKP